MKDIAVDTLCRLRHGRYGCRRRRRGTGGYGKAQKRRAEPAEGSAQTG